MVDNPICGTPEPFKDPLPKPRVCRPEPTGDPSFARLRIPMRRARVELHSQIPSTEVWTYAGDFPGPTIEVERGQRVLVEWANELEGGLPLVSVSTTAVPTDAKALHPQNEPGWNPAQGQVVPGVDGVPPWTVVHLHGGRAAADSDGWTENASLPGQSQWALYHNDQRATMLWYHDHAMGITRLNVFSGLAGLWIIRDEEERRLELPQGDYEIPLLIQDRNFNTAGPGKLTGELLHKVETRDPQNQTMEFFGPYTLVNGVIWPHTPAEPRHYRLRVINGSNARTYQLVLLDEKDNPVTDIIRQIGTDGGLLNHPVGIPDSGLVLAPAERADLIVDFGRCRGQRLRWVNIAAAPYGGVPATDPDTKQPVKPGTASLDDRLPCPNVMRFDVSAEPVEDHFTWKDPLSDFHHWAHDSPELHDPDNTHGHAHRYIALREDQQQGYLYFSELTILEDGSPEKPDLIISPPAKGSGSPPQEVRLKLGDPLFFHDRVNIFAHYNKPEVWNIINLSGDTHPFHVHLVQYQFLERQKFTGYDPDNPGDPPYHLALVANKPGEDGLDANERGWKDTARVNRQEILTIGMVFDGFTGRYMYHCHVLEHEDHEMMRPFEVIPKAVDDLMPMPHHTGHGTGANPMNPSDQSNR